VAAVPDRGPTPPPPDAKQPAKVDASKKDKKKSDSRAAHEINFNWRTSVSLNRLRLHEVDDSALRDDPNLAGWSATESLAAALAQVSHLRRSEAGNVKGLDVVLETRIVRSSDSSADLEYRIVDARTGKALRSGTAHGQATPAGAGAATAMEMAGVLEIHEWQVFPDRYHQQDQSGTTGNGSGEV
jgi:hypothetical protein